MPALVYMCINAVSVSSIAHVHASHPNEIFHLCEFWVLLLSTTINNSNKRNALSMIRNECMCVCVYARTRVKNSPTKRLYISCGMVYRPARQFAHRSFCTHACAPSNRLYCNICNNSCWTCLSACERIRWPRELFGTAQWHCVLVVACLIWCSVWYEFSRNYTTANPWLLFVTAGIGDFSLLQTFITRIAFFLSYPDSRQTQTSNIDSRRGKLFKSARCIFYRCLFKLK